MSDSSTFPFEKIIQSRSTNSGGGVKRWALVADNDGTLYLNRHDSTGGLAETVLTINGTTGAIDANVNTLKPYRLVGADGALTWTTADANGFIDLASSTTGTKAATVVTTGFLAGQTLRFYLLARSGGSYTIAASGLTVTLDAAGEGCELTFNGTAWRISALTGGATAA